MKRGDDNRNYGIDILRILAMFMVVVLHVLGAGGILEDTENMGVMHNAVWLLETAAFCAVDCYALISGYVLSKSRYKYSNIIVLWLQVFVTTVFCYSVFFILGVNEITSTNIKNMLFPVMTGRYWYFTAYFLMYFMIPVLNTAIDKLPRKQFRNMLITILLLVFLSLLFRVDTFHLINGYCCFWLAYLYLLGGYIRKYDPFSKVTWSEGLLLYFSGVMLAFISKSGIEWLTFKIFGEVRYEEMFIQYTSPFIIAAAIGLFITFSKLKVRKGVGIVKFFAPLSFGVYLIHTCCWMGSKFWNFRVFTSHGMPIMLLEVFAISLGVYMLCSVIDFVRYKIFQVFKVKEKVICLEKKLLDRDN